MSYRDEWSEYMGVRVPVDWRGFEWGEQTAWMMGVRDALAPKDDLKCPYTHSHTRQWCGYDTCRES